MNSIRSLSGFLLSIMLLLLPGAQSLGVEPTDFLTQSERQWLAEHPDIRMGFDTRYPPIEFSGNNGEYLGISADYIALIEEQLGIRFTVTPEDSWTGLWDKLKARRLDMQPSAMNTVERSRFMNFTKPYLHCPVVIIVHNGVKGTVTLDMLEGMTVSCVAGFAATKWVHRDYPGILLDPVSDVKTALRKVSFGMTDALIAHMGVASYFIDQEGITNLRAAGETGYVYDLGIACRKDWPELRSILDKALTRISPETRDGIYRKWVHLGAPRDTVWRKRMLFVSAGLAALLLIAAAVAVWNRSLKGQVRRRTEALRQSEERYRMLIETAGEGISIVDLHGRYSFVNGRLAHMLGYSVHEMMGRKVGDFLDEENAIRFKNQFSRRLRGLGDQYDLSLLRKDGSTLFTIVNARPMFDGDGSVLGAFAMITDITDRKRMEEELAKAEKLESVGTLAGGIAHDFNNLLAAILGNISLAGIHADAGTEIGQLIRKAEKAALRAKDLTQQLLTFSKGGAPLFETTSIEDIIRDSAGFAIRGSGAKCEFRISHDLFNVKADPGQISQVINNLVINADQAMPKGGVIRIGAENVTVAHDDDLPLPPANYVKIAVSDSGIGIPEERLFKIFDPFFTTKEKGSGLGLFSCYSIIQKHGGHIGVHSQVRVGTTFTVYLPASYEDVKAQADFGKRAVSGGGHILVVDDEASVRSVMESILLALGYTVCAVADGAEAIEAYERARRNGGGFDAVILDLTIPGGMGGKETLARLKEMDPGVRAIVSSGYATDPVMADPGSNGFCAKLTKPYRVDDIRAVLREVLAGAVIP